MTTAFSAFEFERDTMSPTGREMVFLSPTREQAVDSLLYSERLTNGAAFKHGFCVYSGNKCYSVPQPKAKP